MIAFLEVANSPRAVLVFSPLPVSYDSVGQGDALVHRTDESLTHF